jgi:hypothetical protein
MNKQKNEIEGMNPNRWERNLTKGLNDQKNEMKE